MRNRFRAIYSIQDGYIGKDRPQYCDIFEADIEDDMTEEELRRLYQDSVDEAFHQNISAYGENESSFIRWALETIKARES